MAEQTPIVERSAASFRFARRIARRAGRPLRAPAEVVGVEHKFEILEAGERRDFRTLVEDVIGGADRRWFLGDPVARFLPSGAKITCDDGEVEVATAPIFGGKGVSTIAADEAAARRGELGALLRRYNESAGRSLELRGYATHLNVFVPAGRSPQVALRFARTVAPAAMLLFDLASSPGAAIRSAGRRLEIAGEYLGARDDLRVALTFAIAAVLACDRALPMPELDGSPLEDPRRGGWFIDRTLYGQDLFVEGRMASLRLAGGGTILAGTLLGEIWGAARALVEPHATDEELALVDATVAGARALPLERAPATETDDIPLVPVQEFATILRERRRGEVAVRPACVSWEAATVQISSPARTIYARVPLEGFSAFTTMFERGSLDRLLRSYATKHAMGRVATPESMPGLYDVAEIPQPELDGATARVGTEVTLDPPRKRTVPSARVALSWARRAGLALGALAMFAGTAAFAYIGLRQSEARPVVPKPRTSVLGERASRSPEPSPTPAVSSTPSPTPSPLTFAPPPQKEGPIYIAPPPPSPPSPTRSSTQPSPTRSSSTPRPSPTQTRYTSTPTPTPTQNEARPSITGTTSCGIGTSNLSFQISVPSGAPKIASILVNYNSQQVQPSPPPSYPSDRYSGSASAALAPGGGHKWTVVVRDQGGRVTSKYFIDRC